MEYATLHSPQAFRSYLLGALDSQLAVRAHHARRVQEAQSLPPGRRERTLRLLQIEADQVRESERVFEGILARFNRAAPTHLRVELR